MLASFFTVELGVAKSVFDDYSKAVFKAPRLLATVLRLFASPSIVLYPPAFATFSSSSLVMARPCNGLEGLDGEDTGIGDGGRSSTALRSDECVMILWSDDLFGVFEDGLGMR